MRTPVADASQRAPALIRQARQRRQHRLTERLGPVVPAGPPCLHRCLHRRSVIGRLPDRVRHRRARGEHPDAGGFDVAGPLLHRVAEPRAVDWREIADHVRDDQFGARRAGRRWPMMAPKPGGSDGDQEKVGGERHEQESGAPRFAQHHGVAFTDPGRRS